MTIKEQIAVMQAYASGKEIESRRLVNGYWEKDNEPLWDFSSSEYRQVQDKYSKSRQMVNSLPVENFNITFGCVVNDYDGKLRIVFDSTLRGELYKALDVRGKTCKFKLVPVNDFGEKIIIQSNELLQEMARNK
jgi:hypothetical protein